MQSFAPQTKTHARSYYAVPGCELLCSLPIHFENCQRDMRENFCTLYSTVLAMNRDSIQFFCEEMLHW